MKPPQTAALWLSLLLLAWSPDTTAATLQFAGYEWTVKTGHGGPGPNLWHQHNAWVDDQGQLHLKIARHDNQWSCAEVVMRNRLGFGLYEFEIAGPIDRLDENVVLGLFNYPTPDVGPDATHEIDIEFARWGQPDHPAGNYVVWPAQTGLQHQTFPFPFKLEQDLSLHRFVWTRTRVGFSSWRGSVADPKFEIARWTFEPPNPAETIASQPMPVHLNLWLFHGRPPRNGQEVQLVIRAFRHVASPRPPAGFQMTDRPR